MELMNFNFQKCVSWLLIFLNVLPIIIGFVFLNLFVVDVPYHDQFHNNIPIIIKYHEGIFFISDFLTVNNDHRPIFVNILSFFIDVTTGVNNVIEANVGYLFHVLSFAILWYYCKRSIPSLRPLTLYMLPASWFFFNLYLISAYLWGILLASSLCLVALFSMIFFNEKSRSLDLSFLGAISAAIVGMFSWVAGLFLFPAGLLQLILSQSSKKKEKIIIWIATWAGMLYINYILLGFQSTGIHGYEGYSLYIQSFIHFPIHKCILIVQSLGSTIIHSYIDSFILGLILLLLLVVILIHNRKFIFHSQNAGWFAILLYSLLTHAALVVTRSGDGYFFGPANSLFYIPAVRHFPSTFIFIIGFYGVVLTTFAWYSTHQNDNENGLLKKSLQPHVCRTCEYYVLLGIVVTIILFGYLLHFQNGIFYGVLWAERNCDYRETFLDYDNVNDTILTDLHVTRSTLEKLDEYNMSIFKSMKWGLYPDWLPSSVQNQILNSPRIKIVEWE